jgi:hypothetical protein
MPVSKTMKRLRQVGTVLAIPLLVALVVYVVEAYIFGASPARCNTLFAIHAQLKPGMTRAAIAAVVADHHESYLRTNDQNTSMTVWAYMGRTSVCKLVLDFSDDRLQHARVRTEGDGEQQLSGAPPDF